MGEALNVGKQITVPRKILRPTSLAKGLRGKVQANCAKNTSSFKNQHVGGAKQSQTPQAHVGGGGGRSPHLRLWVFGRETAVPTPKSTISGADFFK